VLHQPRELTATPPCVWRRNCVQVSSSDLPSSIVVASSQGAFDHQMSNQSNTTCTSISAPGSAPSASQRRRF
jgi:hypothetical protein